MKNKTKLARKLRSKEETKKGVGIFLTKEWKLRGDEIAARVQRNNKKNREKSAIRKEEKNKNKLIN
jgi:hypothetical protein